jgi:hypothetical protein
VIVGDAYEFAARMTQFSQRADGLRSPLLQRDRIPPLSLQVGIEHDYHQRFFTLNSQRTEQAFIVVVRRKE